jgi:hypothetical protein
MKCFGHSSGLPFVIWNNQWYAEDFSVIISANTKNFNSFEFYFLNGLFIILKLEPYFRSSVFCAIILLLIWLSYQFWFGGSLHTTFLPALFNMYIFSYVLLSSGILAYLFDSENNTCRAYCQVYSINCEYSYEPRRYWLSTVNSWICGNLIILHHLICCKDKSINFRS